ncbi:MAG: DUF2000 family protein [Dongiaceae bacterium]
MFTTKIALIIRDDLAVWQKLNVAAFLSSGIAAADPSLCGELYRDGAERPYCRMFGQPVLVFSAGRQQLQNSHRIAIERGLTIAPYIEAMFATGHDAANRAVFAAAAVEDLDLVGLALLGLRKDVDRAVRGLPLHT